MEAMDIISTCFSFFNKLPSPLSNGIAAGSKRLGNLLILKAISSQQDDARTKSVSHRSGLTEGGFAQFIPFFLGQFYNWRFPHAISIYAKKGHPIVSAKELITN